MTTRYAVGSASFGRLGRGLTGTLLVGIAAACWAITARRMQGMDMGPGTDLGGFGWFLVVWATMMAAMMLPSLLPVVLGYARSSRQRATGSPSATAVLFAGGYLLTWIVAGALAYALFEGIRGLHLSWLGWHVAGRYIAGGVIVAAALYELTPAKARCLSHCREPERLAARWRNGSSGALQMGLEHGGFCLGATWALMAALFAIGVMNVAWMAVVAALVAVEKLLPQRNLAVWATFGFVGLVGVAVAFAPHEVPGLTIPG